MKLFNLFCQGAIVLQNKPMSFCKAMQSKLKKEAQYIGCKFEIKYNSTTK